METSTLLGPTKSKAKVTGDSITGASAICLYTDSQQAKGHVFLNQHYKMDLCLWYSYPKCNPAFSHLQSVLSAGHTDNQSRCQTVIGQNKHHQLLYIYTFLSLCSYCHGIYIYVAQLYAYLHLYFLTLCSRVCWCNFL